MSDSDAGSGVEAQNAADLVRFRHEKGAISSVIQSTNQGRVLSSGPRAAVHPKQQDARSKTEQRVKFPRHALSQHCLFPLACGNKSMLQ